MVIVETSTKASTTWVNILKSQKVFYPKQFRFQRDLYAQLLCFFPEEAA